MQLNKLIPALEKLGQRITEKLEEPSFRNKMSNAYSANRWFEPKFIRQSLRSIASEYLDKEKLEKWAIKYNVPVAEPKRVALIMAGNLPLVGFHDLLCVLVSGHHAVIRLSAKDRILLPEILGELIDIDPDTRKLFSFEEKLTKYDAVIATGSDNSARYFEYYFGNKPNIIRKNRHSVAILTGHENYEQLKALGEDVLSFFGLGCRSVSHLFVPPDYDFMRFYEAIEPFNWIHESEKYHNNYMYNKSLMIINKVKHQDNGVLMLLENERLSSPMSVLHYSHYSSESEVAEKIKANREKLQVVVGPKGHALADVEFGEAQHPGLMDYADRVDTMEFLSTL